MGSNEMASWPKLQSNGFQTRHFIRVIIIYLCNLFQYGKVIQLDVFTFKIEIYITKNNTNQNCFSKTC